MYYYIYENGNIVGVGYSESEDSSLVQITKEEYDAYIAACKDHNRRLKQFLESNDNSSVPQEFLDEVTQIKNQQNNEELDLSAEEQMRILLGGDITNVAQ